ncbi:hypothetical protein, partial [Rhodococcus sp. BH5]|uniref:hypothetical protein n=1 Tax=Rhodococcus sp. BH5 TaxID=2871702 RepID=UPI0022CD778C
LVHTSHTIVTVRAGQGIIVSKVGRVCYAMPMKKTIALTACAAALLIGGCSTTSESTPAATSPTLSEADQHQAYCDGFARLTPGTLESSAALEVLSDPNSTAAQKSEASRKQLDANVRKTPYDCESASDKQLFDDFVEYQKSINPR